MFQWLKQSLWSKEGNLARDYFFNHFPISYSNMVGFRWLGRPHMDELYSDFILWNLEWVEINYRNRSPWSIHIDQMRHYDVHIVWDNLISSQKEMLSTIWTLIYGVWLKGTTSNRFVLITLLRNRVHLLRGFWVFWFHKSTVIQSYTSLQR